MRTASLWQAALSIPIPYSGLIEEGYVKRLKAVVLNPRTLRYVRRDTGQEIEVSLDEVRQLGEQDSDFRRSIVTSNESRDTIVSASLRELDKLRAATGDKRLKIIASALNFKHCGEIVAAYRARNRRADYVHSREDSAANERVMQKLENDQLDVIVQVRKLERVLTIASLPLRPYSASSAISRPSYSSWAGSCV